MSMKYIIIHLATIPTPYRTPLPYLSTPMPQMDGAIEWSSCQIAVSVEGSLRSSETSDNVCVTVHHLTSGAWRGEDKILLFSQSNCSKMPYHFLKCEIQESYWKWNIDYWKEYFLSGSGNSIIVISHQAPITHSWNISVTRIQASKSRHLTLLDRATPVISIPCSPPPPHLYRTPPYLYPHRTCIRIRDSERVIGISTADDRTRVIRCDEMTRWNLQRSEIRLQQIQDHA